MKVKGEELQKIVGWNENGDPIPYPSNEEMARRRKAQEAEAIRFASLSGSPEKHTPRPWTEDEKSA